MKTIQKIKEVFKLNNKGQVFGQISQLMVGLAGLVVTAVVVFLLMSNISTNAQVVADPNASAAVDVLQNSADDAVGFVPLIVIAAIGAILLSLVALFRASQR